MWETSNKTFVSVPSLRFCQNIPKLWHNIQQNFCQGNLIMQQWHLSRHITLYIYVTWRERQRHDLITYYSASLTENNHDIKSNNTDDDPATVNPIWQLLGCWITNTPLLSVSHWHRCLFFPYLPMWVWEHEFCICSLALACVSGLWRRIILLSVFKKKCLFLLQHVLLASTHPVCLSLRDAST